tara:strand:- start:110 stop:568 length:459 start_codon:yes stop_codon:yes gene_type:complete
MEFIDYLNIAEIEIIQMLEKAGYNTVENTGLCLLGKEYVGFLKKKEKTIVICTNNAKKIERYGLIKRKDIDIFERTATHIKKALRHEAVHVAQECNGGKLLDIKKNLKINPAKVSALKGSINISGEGEKERQAYILESNPKFVKKELEKYCL